MRIGRLLPWISFLLALMKMSAGPDVDNIGCTVEVLLEISLNKLEPILERTCEQRVNII